MHLRQNSMERIQRSPTGVEPPLRCAAAIRSKPLAMTGERPRRIRRIEPFDELVRITKQARNFAGASSANST